VKVIIRVEDGEPLPPSSGAAIAEAILQGRLDADLEVILEAGHRRKRIRRGTRVVPRRVMPLQP